MNSESCWTPAELAARWKSSTSTLERWRTRGIGPRYLKIGGQVRYPDEDVREFEERSRRQSTSMHAPDLS